MGNWSIRLLSFVWVLIRVIIISRTDHAGMRGGGGDVWHFKTKKEAPGSFTTLVGSKEVTAIHCVFVVLFFKEDAERETPKRGSLIGLRSITHTHTHKTCTLMTYRAVGNGGMSNIDECTTYFCVVENKRRRTIIITSTIISLRLECLSFPWVCVCTHKYYMKEKKKRKKQKRRANYFWTFFDVITTTSSSLLLGE